MTRSLVPITGVFSVHSKEVDQDTATAHVSPPANRLFQPETLS